LAANAHGQAVTRIEVSTTSDDILVYGPACAANVPAVIRESDKNFKTIISLLHTAQIGITDLTINDGGVCRIGTVRTGAPK
jgi:hypothetical protein